MEGNPFSALDPPAMESRKSSRPAAPSRALTVLMRGRDRFAAACREQTPVVLEKFLFFGGMAAFVCGCWMIYRPLGPIVGGAIAVWLGMLISMERDEPRP